ncbi:MAG: DNA mismatch repair endonuclease MutL [Oscillospiraceae bacterium]|nr:DNA mismatch repair endonuclease MutL [Oscillospiraceae bacterium]
MPEIRILEKHVAELIAAGEVIEKPVSVVKELVENAIDAGAGRITVEIKNGGTTFMRIQDDGCGMSAEDLPKAFLRHATSKVQQKEDLETIHTLGFRGEALASVAAVSKVTVMTKRPEDSLGSQYEIIGGEGEAVEECGCPDGTTLLIRDLFFNVPARRKFMKRDTTEGNAIAQMVQKIAISHPEIAFKFIRDNRLDFYSDGTGDLLTAIRAVYGREFAGDLIPVSGQEGDITVTGYVIKPLYAKSNRSFQNFFVNTRCVKSVTCRIALESAYENLLMTNKFPACVMLLTMPPDTLDVNIHPAKAEVRFSDERKIIDAIYNAVKRAFVEEGLIYGFQTRKQDNDSNYSNNSNNFNDADPEFRKLPVVHQQIPEESPRKLVFQSLHQEDMPFRVQLPGQNLAKNSGTPGTSENAVNSEPLPKSVFVSESFIDIEGEPEEELENLEKSDITESMKFREFQEIPENSENSAPPRIPEEFPDVRVIGELFANYIIAQSGDSMILIDKHAAHERIIFERLRTENCRQYQQILLHPVRTLLTMNEFSAVEENQELLENMGFSVDFSQKPELITMGAPLFFEHMQLDEIMQEIAHNFYLGKVNPQSHKLDDLLHTLACRSAIKANDKNSLEELQALAEQVCHNRNIRHCPHGRPVLFVMTKYQLEKEFRRRL